MINELYQLIRVLEKLNVQLNTEIVTDQKVEEAKNAIVDLQNNQKLLMHFIQKGMDSDSDIEETLVLMHESLENIVQNLDNIRELIILAMDRYCDYLDKVD